MKAIRLKCLDCSAGSPVEVRLCPVDDCSLYPYRFGKRPATIAKKAIFAESIVMKPGTQG